VTSTSLLGSNDTFLSSRLITSAHPRVVSRAMRYLDDAASAIPEKSCTSMCLYPRLMPVDGRESGILFLNIRYLVKARPRAYISHHPRDA